MLSAASAKDRRRTPFAVFEPDGMVCAKMSEFIGATGALNFAAMQKAFPRTQVVWKAKTTILWWNVVDALGPAHPLALAAADASWRREIRSPC